MFLKPNGCDENGWDHFEQHVREEFETSARRWGVDVTRDGECSLFYKDNTTELLWKYYHLAHVCGREFILNQQGKNSDRD